MANDIVDARHLGQHRLHLRFEDGVDGEVDIASMIDFTASSPPLTDPTYLAQVTTNPEVGTITWSNSVDLHPDVLYIAVTGIPIEPHLAPPEAMKEPPLAQFLK